MLDPVNVAVDHALVIVTLAAYLAGALVLTAYFLLRTPMIERAGIVFACLACVLQFAELGTRWHMTGVWPLTNLYGSLSLFSGLGVLIYIVFARKYDLWLIGGGVLGISAMAFGYATTWNEGYMPAVPALQSYWIKVHVPIVVASYASFMVAFVVSALYLFKAYAEQKFGAPRTAVMRADAAGAGTMDMSVALSSPPSLARNAAQTETPNVAAAAAAGDPWAAWLTGLPSLARLDMLTYRIISIGLVLLSVGIITGAMWANEAWGAYWSWDPKETAALLSWIIYAAFMHLHTRSSWRGERAAIVSIAGFISIMFCYLGVNIWISGLHSYRM